MLLKKLKSLKPAKYGFLFNKGSLWVGIHYSKFNKRLCVNVIPCCTFWCIQKGGYVPTESSK